MFCLPHFAFVEEYMMLFHICGRIHDIFPHFFWKYTYSLLNISRGLCIVLNLPHCGRMHDTFYITFVLKYIFLTCLTFVEGFHLPDLRKNTLCFSTFLFCESIFILPCLKFVGNIGKSSTFHIFETIHNILPHFMEVYISFHLRFAEFYVYTSTFHIVEDYIRLFYISLLLKTLNCKEPKVERE